jgi:hypothetical protein
MSRSLDMTPAGLPHSEIPGSKRACRSPRLIAACCVLHRLSVPRHPPSTLSNLTIKCLDLMRSAVESHYNGFDMHLFSTTRIQLSTNVRSRRSAVTATLEIAATADPAATSFLRRGLIANRPVGQPIPAQPFARLVELIGIEPTTPCLQSRRSPS